MSQPPPADSRHSFAQGQNAAYIEDLYAQYRKDKQSVDASWQQFFEGVDFAIELAGRGAKSGSTGSSPKAASTSGANAGGAAHEGAMVEALINAYRRLGHLSADLNPLYPQTGIADDMSLAAHGLGQVSPDREFLPANIIGKSSMALGEIHDFLLKTYCGRIGADFRDINNIEIVTWLQDQMEACQNRPSLSEAMKKRILSKLGQAEGFERFLQARYLGQKRFSVEGADALIPMLDILCNEASKGGVEEISMGMAHRGRLNILCNVLGKSFETMLREFEGSEYNPFDIDGDVKYHLGFANEIETLDGNRIRIFLAPNPSHLEIINPVIEGFTRSRQRLLSDVNQIRTLPLLLHGDAAFIGQGITAETFNLSELAAYKTGGTIHVITNNQIGFTTEPHEGRSTTYASGIAKIISAPVLHVNADDPEACIWVAQLAVAYRQRFKKDIVIDLIGYRRHGHNETDEPGYTQPKMYKIIKDHPTAFEIYGERLTKEGLISKEKPAEIAREFRDKMQASYELIKGGKSKFADPPPPPAMEHSFRFVKASREDIDRAVDTRLSLDLIRDLSKQLTTLPLNFTVHPKLVKLVETRSHMADGNGSIDWAFAELLAFASLARDGKHVRLSGQDCKRGTFSSRHGVLKDFETAEEYSLFHPFAGTKGRVDIINSPLSELACLGFEFGYSIADQDALVLWEAQFGDFFNGAQIIIDQFIVACEAKWKQMSGIVLLLPHGHEGMGPEHSSARPERFLQLCGNLNIQVANVTTPAQYFHLLRRQMLRGFRKPLVVMSPKSLLRRPEVVSKNSEFTDGAFRELIDDVSITDKKKVQDAILCTGKIYYDLIETRNRDKDLAASVPVIRLEQLYPFPKAQVSQLRKDYPNLKRIIWTQEEPQNMGAWNFLEPRLARYADCAIEYVGRKHSGSTAEGSLKAHQVEQGRIIDDALGLTKKLQVKKA